MSDHPQLVSAVGLLKKKVLQHLSASVFHLLRSLITKMCIERAQHRSFRLSLSQGLHAGGVLGGPARSWRWGGLGGVKLRQRESQCRATLSGSSLGSVLLGPAPPP